MANGGKVIIKILGDDKGFKSTVKSVKNAAVKTLSVTTKAITAGTAALGGGILSVVDGEMGIGIFGPALDKKGNSVAGECVLEYMSHELHLHMFDPQRHTL